MQNIIKKSFVYLMITAVIVALSFPVTLTDTYAASAPKKITLKAQVSSKTVDIGGKIKVSVYKTTPKKSSKAVTWKIVKGKNYASLISKKSSSVYVKGKKSGTVTLKAISKYNKKVTKTIKIKVKNLKAKNLTLNTSAYTIGIDENYTLKATVAPPQKYGYKTQKTTWKSSNTSVVTVSDQGVISGEKVGTATITATNDGKSASCNVTVTDSKVILSYVLAGRYSTSKINNTEIDNDAKVLVWNKIKKKYSAAKNDKATILGQFVELEDTDADKKADIVKVVKYNDRAAKWNKNMTWLDGIGEDVEPALSDDDATIYDARYRIPFGERQLSGYGVTDYCGTTDFSDQEESSYWPAYDYYNLRSGNGLTLLEGYKTQSQSTGWACVMTSAVTVLDWYDGYKNLDLNEQDLAALREKNRDGGGSSLTELENVFKNLTTLGITGGWKITDSYTSGAEDNLYDPDWIKGELAKGNPIIVIWNSFGAHAQVIIGYDDMKTPDDTADDQLILMDPYDTTDHSNDGYTIQSYERLAYGLLTWDGSTKGTQFFVAEPKSGFNFKPSTGKGLARNVTNTFKSNDNNKLNDKLYGPTKAQFEAATEYYNNSDIGPKFDLSGAAGWEREFEVNKSPYYYFNDYYNGNDPSGTLDIIENYQTIQQATEWTCGCTTALMVMEHFAQNGTLDIPLETEISLCEHRQNGDIGATYLSGMEEMFDYMNTEHDQDWVSISRNDMTDPDSDWSTVEGTSGDEYVLQGGSSDGGLIPYFIEKDIPVMIGWDEWGGHWQAIIGYDDMGTPQTQDDVIILADPYDTTDHESDGYVVESFERLVYGWNSAFEMDGQETDSNNFIIAFPNNAETADVVTEFGLN